MALELDGMEEAEQYKNLTVVIPVLNEEEAIGKVLEEVINQAKVPKDKILIVDGKSTDKTVEIAKSYGVKVIEQEGIGKSMAIKTALNYVGTEYILIMDGDYTYPAKYIVDLYREIKKEKDIVIGSRKKLEKGAQGLIYKIGNFGLTLTFNILFGTRISDVLSGMYIVRTDILREISFNSKNFGIESEILAHVVSEGGYAGEIQIEYRKRIGKKKLGVLHGFHIFVDMIKLMFNYNPTFFIFILGSLLLIPGLALGLYVAYYYFFTDITYYVKGLVAIMLTLAGFQSLLLAVLTLFIKRMEIRFLRLIRKSRGR
ncbi:glycosyltransferase [Fervidicoccus fontis]|uniref:Glycosyltransferase n=1 Tax=Fervidicoccus fontis TaxID=683846 RepID=A0A843ABD4_9CREN|nr:glycosyltransferase family 2 protein [Fervidicoccus fontis]MBE9391132.1 glycosyltransferase [Fervidicoccus fontis]